MLQTAVCAARPNSLSRPNLSETQNHPEEHVEAQRLSTWPHNAPDLNLGEFIRRFSHSDGKYSPSLILMKVSVDMLTALLSVVTLTAEQLNQEMGGGV